MKSKKLLFRIAFLIVLIFFLNLVAMKFYWYNSIWWFDMLMHFLGGFWLGLVFFFILKIKECNFHNIISVLVGVLAVGLLWEVFEVALNSISLREIFDIEDTISDLFFDLSGGFAACIYFFTRILKEE